mmetsp:Transcript_68937/g.128726  ORF Transcript_68937/g.128726 Transcript_68937/m.128726 type:complete len:101 (+) Transcript_68937:48-350(+)
MDDIGCTTPMSSLQEGPFKSKETKTTGIEACSSTGSLCFRHNVLLGPEVVFYSLALWASLFGFFEKSLYRFSRWDATRGKDLAAFWIASYTPLAPEESRY